MLADGDQQAGVTSFEAMDLSAVRAVLLVCVEEQLQTKARLASKRCQRNIYGSDSRSECVGPSTVATDQVVGI